MTKILPISKARDELPQIVNKAKSTLNKYIITVNGVPEAVLISHEEYESLMETLDFLSQPGALDDINKSEKELKTGKYISLDDLKSELGIVV